MNGGKFGAPDTANTPRPVESNLASLNYRYILTLETRTLKMNGDDADELENVGLEDVHKFQQLDEFLTGQRFGQKVRFHSIRRLVGDFQPFLLGRLDDAMGDHSVSFVVAEIAAGLQRQKSALVVAV